MNRCLQAVSKRVIGELSRDWPVHRSKLSLPLLGQKYYLCLWYNNAGREKRNC